MTEREAERVCKELNRAFARNLVCLPEQNRNGDWVICAVEKNIEDVGNGYFYYLQANKDPVDELLWAEHDYFKSLPY